MKLHITFHFRSSDINQEGMFLRRVLNSKQIMEDFRELEKTYYRLQVDFTYLLVRNSFNKEICIVENYRGLHDTFTVKELSNIVKDIKEGNYV